MHLVGPQRRLLPSYTRGQADEDDGAVAQRTGMAVDRRGLAAPASGCVAATLEPAEALQTVANLLQGSHLALVEVCR